MGKKGAGGSVPMHISKISLDKLVDNFILVKGRPVPNFRVSSRQKYRLRQFRRPEGGEKRLCVPVIYNLDNIAKAEKAG